MKSKFYPWLLFSFLYTAISVYGQKPVYPIPNSSDQIPFGKKQPMPVLNARNAEMEKTLDPKMKGLTSTTFDTVLKQFIVTTPGRRNSTYPTPLSFNNGNVMKPATNPVSTSSCFHLTRDINTATGSSDPTNYPIGAPYSFAVLNSISYFSADDGINGRELWRSDGTAAGTWMVKDINPGVATSDVSGIIAANGLLYFSVSAAENGIEPWVSDGTAAGTHLLKDIHVGINSSYPNHFINVNGSVFFVATTFNFNTQLWKTDGTEAGTILIKDFDAANIGHYILQLTAVNNIVYFTAYTWASGHQLFRTDGTEAGTYMVRQIGVNQLDWQAPTQLTSYNNKLYFSADDGTGRKLWVTDGTIGGTGYAAGNEVFIQRSHLNIFSNTPFLILNNALFISGFTYTEGDGLYKYDASNADGIVLVKDISPGGEFAFVVPIDMRVVNDAIYFRVISSANDLHDELWITKGEPANTKQVKIFAAGEYIYSLYNSNGAFFFVKYDNVYGNELWKSNGTDAGTVLVKDIIIGNGGSFPENLTFCNGKLLFRATGSNTGNELWSSNGTGPGTSLVKDINFANTVGSDAGFIYKGMATSGNGVVFGAYTPELGVELYKSDGTGTRTKLLNDIATGSQWSYPNSIIYKNGMNYFIGDNLVGTSIYKTDGTAGGLKKIVYDIDRVVYYVTNFNVTDNGMPFYILANRNTGAYELWRSDGTAAGTFVLTPNLYYNSYIATAGNTVYFVAGDSEHGFELWKSNGTVAGTKMVKDIRPGFNGSYPYSLFVYKNNVYFGAHDGLGLNNQTWKSDGTEKGTIKLKNITPAFYDYNVTPDVQVFCVSNNKLFFTAYDYQTYGAELWETNGTAGGTKLVKDVNPYGHSFPYFLTDVNGVLYFTADDGVHGNELWTSKGTSQSTKLVKDITPDYTSYLINLCSAGGKLFFLNFGTLWSSDGTVNNTNQITDPGLNGLSEITRLTAAGNKLFFGANSQKYGRELFVGEACSSNFTAGKAVIPEMLTPKPTTVFDVLLYPNPAKGSASLRINGDAKDIAVTIADISGKVVWQKSFSSATQVSLPVEKLTAGIYMVTIKSGSENKVLKLVKQ